MTYLSLILLALIAPIWLAPPYLLGCALVTAWRAQRRLP